MENQKHLCTKNITKYKKQKHKPNSLKYGTLKVDFPFFWQKLIKKLKCHNPSGDGAGIVTV